MSTNEVQFPTEPGDEFFEDFLAECKVRIKEIIDDELITICKDKDKVNIRASTRRNIKGMQVTDSLDEKLNLETIATFNRQVKVNYLKDQPLRMFLFYDQRALLVKSPLAATIANALKEKWPTTIEQKQIRQIFECWLKKTIANYVDKKLHAWYRFAAMILRAYWREQLLTPPSDDASSNKEDPSIVPASVQKTVKNLIPASVQKTVKNLFDDNSQLRNEILSAMPEGASMSMVNDKEKEDRIELLKQAAPVFVHFGIKKVILSREFFTTHDHVPMLRALEEIENKKLQKREQRDDAQLICALTPGLKQENIITTSEKGPSSPKYNYHSNKVIRFDYQLGHSSSSEALDIELEDIPTYGSSNQSKV
ncbi:MAG: hypothetical protein K2Q14_06440 [Gammaproteobacteria bacterium]|nr:hypothetical protein [Gammaproteobacteria bacterium]